MQADGNHFFGLNGDSEVMQYVRPVKTRVESDQFLLENIVFYSRHPSLGRWALIRKSDDGFVGSFAIIPLENSEHMQVGYMLLREHWGHGYASEALRAGIHYAFDTLKLPKLIAVTETANLPSQKVLAKCGFAQSAHFMEKKRRLVLYERANPHFAETERLFIFPLTIAQLEIYLEGAGKLERHLGLAVTERHVSATVRSVVESTTLKYMRKSRPEEVIFLTFWLAVDKSSRMIVAELGFKGAPDYGGNIEIGYGTMPGMEGRGFMTEAVNGMLRWAGTRNDVQMMLAETARANLASIRVLEKNDFRQFAEKENMLWWRYVLR